MLLPARRFTPISAIAFTMYGAIVMLPNVVSRSCIPVLGVDKVTRLQAEERPRTRAAPIADLALDLYSAGDAPSRIPLRRTLRVPIADPGRRAVLGRADAPGIAGHISV